MVDAKGIKNERPLTNLVNIESRVWFNERDEIAFIFASRVNCADNDIDRNNAYFTRGSTGMGEGDNGGIACHPY